METGYPIPEWEGNPFQVRGTPSWPGQGVPHPRMAEGVVHPRTGGYPSQDEGTPSQDRGYPSWQCQEGVPPIWDWATPEGPWTSLWGMPLGRDLGPVTGVPLRKDMGPVEVLWDGDGYPRVWTDTHLWKQYLPVVLRTRTVTNWKNSHSPISCQRFKVWLEVRC